jgi:hypothetical protein
MRLICLFDGAQPSDLSLVFPFALLYYYDTGL